MTNLTIEGMTCGHCRQAVNDALAKVPGVTAVRIDLERGEAQVEGSTDVAALIAAVQEEGYDAKAA